jgi:hypothetical protein
MWTCTICSATYDAIPSTAMQITIGKGTSKKPQLFRFENGEVHSLRQQKQPKQPEQN